MTAREHILQQVKRNKPVTEALPDFPAIPFITGGRELAAIFSEVAKRMGSTVMEAAGALHWLQDQATSGTAIHSFAEGFDFRSDRSYPAIVVAPGSFAVAENACVWVDDSTVGELLHLFTCIHIVLVVEKNNVLGNMHDAYHRLGHLDMVYGVFIAGPSKTADIEQVLVTGAHGPRQCTVVLI